MSLDKYQKIERIGGWRSSAGHRLCIANDQWDFHIQPLLTVELRTKWYRLCLLHDESGNGVELYAIHFGHLEEAAARIDVTAFCDHVPNPTVVRLFARQNGYEIDELAWDLIVGRWQSEVKNQDEYECWRCDGAGVIPPKETLGVLPSVCRACKGLGATNPGA